jgi:3'-5' exoribonuclease
MGLDTQIEIVSLAEAGKYEDQLRTVDLFLAVSAKQLRTKKDGTTFLSLRLSDRNGQCEAVMWENFESLLPEFNAGDVIKVRARVSRYGGKLQLLVSQLRRAAENEYELSDFTPHTRFPIDELWQKLSGFADTIADPHLHALVASFLDDPEIAKALRAAPAAKSMHHAWIGGLLEHIVSLLGICDRAAAHYPQVNRDLLLTGAILHDIGKLQELRWAMTFDYTLEGQMLGHITLGIRMIEQKIDAIPNFPEKLRLLVEHLVLSHHGRYEFGSPKLPMTPEAILLHYLDDIDAKMHTVESELARSRESGREADEMTDWVRSLERPLLDTRGFLATDAESETAEASLQQPERQAAEQQPEPRQEDRQEEQTHALFIEE